MSHIQMANPPHPGGFIQRNVIQPLALGVPEAAEVLGVDQASLAGLVEGRDRLSPEMAVRIEKAFGPKADHLLRMQLVYDIAQANRRRDEIKVRRYEPA